MQSSSKTPLNEKYQSKGLVSTLRNPIGPKPARIVAGLETKDKSKERSKSKEKKKTESKYVYDARMYYDPAKEKQSEDYRLKRDAFLKSLNSKSVRKKPYATFWYPEIAWTHSDEVLQSPGHKEKFHKINVKERLGYKKNYQNEIDEKERSYKINKEEKLYDKKPVSYMEKFDSRNIKRMYDEMNDYFDDISNKKRLIDKEIYKDNDSNDEDKLSRKSEIYNDRKSKSKKLSVDMNDEFYKNSRSRSRSFKLKSKSDSDSVYDYNSGHSVGKESYNGEDNKKTDEKELKVEDNKKIDEKVEDDLKMDDTNMKAQISDDEATEENKKIQEVIQMTEKLLEGLGKERSFRKIRKVVLGYFRHTDDRDTMKVFLSRKMLRSCSEVNLYSDSSYQPVACPVQSSDDVFVDEEKKASFNVEEFIKKYAVEGKKVKKVLNGKTSRKKHLSEKKSEKSSHKKKKKYKDSCNGSDYDKKSHVTNSSKKNEKIEKRKDEKHSRSKTNEKKKYKDSEEKRKNYIHDQPCDEETYRPSYVDKDTGKRFKNLKIEIRNAHHNYQTEEQRHGRRSYDYKLGNKEERYYIDKHNRPSNDFSRDEDELYEHYHGRYQEPMYVDQLPHPHYKPTSHFNHKYRPNNEPYYINEYYDRGYDRYDPRYRMQSRRRDEYEDRIEHANRAPIFTKNFSKNHHRHSYNDISNATRRNVHERLGKKIEDP